MRPFDIPGAFTFTWCGGMIACMASRGDFYNVAPAFGALMLLASPVAVPLCVVGDVINTALLPIKVGYRFATAGKNE